MEDSVTSSLNLFDIAVRLVPGALVLAACGFFSGWCSEICGDDAITLFLAFVASYTVGTLLRFPAKFLSELIHLIAYDGNPRDRYPDRGSRKGRLGFTGRSVIRDPSTRALGLACRRAIAKHYGLKHVEPRFAFGFMINYLEAEGVSAKGDRMCSISDMCLFLNVVFLVGTAAYSLSGQPCMAVLLGACEVICVHLFVRYEEIRFKTIVRTFAITYPDVGEVMNRDERSAEGSVCGRSEGGCPCLAMRHASKK